MKRIPQAAALILVAAALLGGTAWAGNIDRLGTAGAQELRIPVGTRGMGLGGSTVASNHGIESIYYNPAGLAATPWPTTIVGADAKKTRCYSVIIVTS